MWAKFVASRERHVLNACSDLEMLHISRGLGQICTGIEYSGVRRNCYLIQSSSHARSELVARTANKYEALSSFSSQLLIHTKLNTAIAMQTTMANTMNLSVSRAAPLSSVRRCSALGQQICSLNEEQ